MIKAQLEKKVALALILFAALIGGGIATFSKIALEHIPPLTFTLLRFLLATLILIPFFLSKKAKIQPQDFKDLILASLLATLNVTFFILGVKKTTATIAQMLYAATPIIAGVFSYFLLKEKINLKKLTGILLGFIGVLIIILLPLIGKTSLFSGNLTGNLLIFIGVTSFSLYTVLSKKFQKKYSPLTLTLLFALTTIFVQMLLAPVELKANPDWWKQLSLVSLAALAYVAIIGTALFYLVYQSAIKKATPVTASMTLYLQPVFGFIWAFFLLGEKLTLGFVLGAILAFIGAGITTYSNHHE